MSFRIVLLTSVCSAAIVCGQANTFFTTASIELDTTQTTNVTQTVNTFSTEIKARMQGGGFLYDQTFPVAFSDPGITTAIAQAKSVLSGAGAVSFTGPTQLSNTQTLANTSTNTVPTGQTAQTPTSVTGQWVGPATLLTGNLGVCGTVSSTPPTLPGGALAPSVSGYLFVSNCSSGGPFTLLSGQIDFDTQVVTRVTKLQTTTTTNTFLISQVYEIDGLTTAPAATPAPPSLMLAFAGLLGMGLWTLVRRRPAGPASS